MPADNFSKLKRLLEELFQLDQPDLDFGLYRIMHAKAGEISQFLEKDLLPQVQAAFGEYQSADKAELEKEITKARAQAKSLGIDPDDSPTVQEMQAAYNSSTVDVATLENEVYDHLYSFFRRYYHEGDFLSKRVYKPGVYAIPYEGEEVKLHWANRDQYYIKTSEYLRDYAFRLHPDDEAHPMRVHFKLVDASEGEHGNVKATEGNDRVFILAAAGESGHEFLTLANGELFLSFEYRQATMEDWTAEAKNAATAAAKKKPPVQAVLLAQAEQAILATTDEATRDWIAQFSRLHVKTNGERADYTRLAAHLKRYAARNTFDYFIHKDLDGFLRRELDFYIKNEVMHLDDIEHDTAPRVEQYLSKIKVIRKIAGKIITFLAQLEEFQKKLWLKKKFVVETHYCITLDRIPEELYPEIASNDAQRQEWVKLFAIDEIESEELGQVSYSVPLSNAFLELNQNLILDTQFFDESFNHRLIDNVDDMSADSCGLLVHSENSQGLRLLQKGNCQQIDCIYIDPPYNASASEIIYKNNYKHSTWCSFMEERLREGFGLLRESGILCITIDDYEYHLLKEILDGVFGVSNFLATVPIRNNPSGRSTVSGFAVCHEYALFYAKDHANSVVGRLPHNEEQKGRYDELDGNGRSFEWENFRKSSAGSFRIDRPKQFYPVYVNKISHKIRIPNAEWNDSDKKWINIETRSENEVAVFPIDSQSRERVWNFGMSRARQESESMKSDERDGVCEIYKRKYLQEGGILPRTWWDKPEYSARDNGTRALNNLFSGSREFDFPKAVSAVTDCLRVSSLGENGSCLDYFAGSGSTGDAITNLNRTDAGRRKFILMEMGKHFDTVLKPRILKTSYSPAWKNGKPQSRHSGISQLFKYVRLESYEDALNNLETKRDDAQQELLTSTTAQGAGGLKEQYLLSYMLDVETRGSPSLLNIEAFQDPTAYRLKVKVPSSDESREVKVDLLETFNYLVGLTVQHIAAPHTFTAKFERDAEDRLKLNGRLTPDPDGPFWFRTVTGTTPNGQKTLIIWRKLTGTPEEDNLVLDTWFTKQGYSTRDQEFQLIYVNGDNNLENLKAAEDIWKVRLIEEDFHRLMFDTSSL